MRHHHAFRRAGAAGREQQIREVVGRLRHGSSTTRQRRDRSAPRIVCWGQRRRAPSRRHGPAGDTASGPAPSSRSGSCAAASASAISARQPDRTQHLPRLGHRKLRVQRHVPAARHQRPENPGERRDRTVREHRRQRGLARRRPPLDRGGQAAARRRSRAYVTSCALHGQARCGPACVRPNAGTRCAARSCHDLSARGLRPRRNLVYPASRQGHCDFRQADQPQARPTASCGGTLRDDYRAGLDHRALPDAHVGQDHAVRPDEDVVLDDHRAVADRLPRPPIEVRDDGGPDANRAVVADRQRLGVQFVDDRRTNRSTTLRADARPRATAAAAAGRWRRRDTPWRAC